MAESRRYEVTPQLDIQQILQEAQHRWLRPAEICEILQNYRQFRIAPEPPNMPPSGSLFLFDRKVLRYFRKDGHNWRKKKDGKTVKEAHERLKSGSVDVLHCYYAHGEENENFQRRSYWMLEEDFMHIVLVHYREVKNSKASYIRTRDAEEIAQVANVESPCSSSFTNHSQLLSQVTDAGSPISTQTLEYEDAESDNYQANPRYHSFAEMQQYGDGPVTDNRLLNSYAPIPLPNDQCDHQRLQASRPESDLYSVAQQDVSRVFDESGLGLAFTGSKAQFGLNSWEEVLENCMVEMPSAPFNPTVASTQAANLDTPQQYSLMLGEYFMNDLGLNQENVVSAQGTPVWQLELGNAEVGSPVTSNLNVEGDLSIEGNPAYASLLKQLSLDLSNTGGEGLKKHDSFSRWMSNELGEVDDLHLQSTSGVYWSTIESESVGDVSGMCNQEQLDSYLVGPSISLEQLFSIVDFSPSWAYTRLETKQIPGETSDGEVVDLNFMNPTTEHKAGSSTAHIAHLFSEASYGLCRDGPVYGRDEDKKKVIELLFSNDCMDHNISIIRLEGVGGVGKTALVKLVYDFLIAYGIFEARAWVCVNERLDVKGLTKAIIESLTGWSCGLTELTEVQVALREELMGKRFLLVLDNVCDDDLSFWSSLLVPLSIGARGSMVLATIRKENKSVFMDMMHSYILDPLPENVCRLIFEMHILDGCVYNHNLMNIGRQIIPRCEGLPLAVKTIGGILRSELNEKSWNAVLESDLWDSNRNLPALTVSYNHLTLHLKRCFQYCSLFPKGYIFEKDNLVRLWMSQGFIEYEEGRHERETGNRYFDVLLERSLFQHSPLCDPMENKYVIHDLCHDLAQSVEMNKFLRAETCKLSSIPDAVCHVSLVPSVSDTVLQFESFKEPRDIHTLLLINPSIMKWEASVFQVEDPATLNNLFSHSRCLRTLDLSFTNIEVVPETIANLQQLRYIALNKTSIRKLPESICSLKNLQTLELRGCNYLSELPTNMKSLTNLQHLDAWNEFGFILMPSGIGKLSGLRTLSTFTVGSDEQHCGIRELKDLMNLSGSLCIGGLGNVVRGEEAEEAKLEMKENLRSLTLQWFNSGEDRENDQNEETAFEVLQNLKPHKKLEELTLRDYSGNRFPNWMEDPYFYKLISITLDNCYECSMLPQLGQLPSLKYLSMRMLDGVQSMGHQFCGSGTIRGFPSLETLKLWGMCDLEEWWGVKDGDFPCLGNLSISSCNKLRRIPCFTSLEELSVHCCAQFSLPPTLPNLKSLKIEGLENLKSLLQQVDLPALKLLEISCCDKLMSLEGLCRIASLEQLKIVTCPNLNFSPKEQIPSMLQCVDICHGCSLLNNWCPDGFEEIINIHQARRKLVRQMRRDN